MSRIKSNHMVVILDMKALNSFVLDYLVSQGVDIADNTRIKPYATLGIVTGVNGKHYLINTEGVGFTKSLEDENASVEFYKETVDKKGNVTAFEIYPFVRVGLDKAELINHVSGEIKPLHEFVRTFGDRLDANYEIWERFLITGK